jgi:hypothetical protein
MPDAPGAAGPFDDAPPEPLPERGQAHPAAVSTDNLIDFTRLQLRCSRVSATRTLSTSVCDTPVCLTAAET